ncbi:hypothetical protein MKW92_020727, partial [Papaver armeniacum]
QISRKIGNLKNLTSRPNGAFSVKGNGDVDVQLKMVIKGINYEVRDIIRLCLTIDLSCNNIDGNIPKEIVLLKGLYMLNLSHNHFSNNIPASVGDISRLESLDLSFNRLSGNIPPSLTSIDSLGFLNLSYNRLSGKILKGTYFETLSWDGSTFLGNFLLCVPPTKKVCEGEQNVINANEVQEDDQDDTNERIIFYGIVALGFGVGFWGVFLVLLIKKEKWWFGYWC